MVQGAFEEMAVEGLLLEKYSNGDFTYVGTRFARNAVWYMKLNRDAAFKQTRGIEKEIAKLKKLAGRSNDAKALQSITESEKFYSDLRSSTQFMIDQAENRAGLMSVMAIDFSGAAPALENPVTMEEVEEHLRQHSPETAAVGELFPAND